jgi:signal transduction histidine kinase
VAADFAGEAPYHPDRESFAAVAQLPGATHLAAPAAGPEHGELARRTRCQAAVPIVAGGAPLAALLIAGEVRPRALAELDAAAARLASPVANALALGRLERLDDAVRQLDRLAALGTLAAEIAHEVRNPLVTLQTFLQLLPERREDPEFLTRYLDVVRGELGRMDRLLDLVVDHARPGPPDEAQPTDPARVLASVAELLRHRALEAGVRLVAETAEDTPAVELAEDGLRQVLLNLALNAVDATPEGGEILLSASARGEEVEIRVRDGGPGIPADLRERVFDPFVTTRGDRPGGLGLAISRRIVEEAGGAIEAREAPGGGAEIRVRLPAA